MAPFRFQGMTENHLRKRRRLCAGMTKEAVEILGSDVSDVLREILPDPEQNIPKRDWEFQLYFAKQQFRTLLELLGKAPPGLV